MRPILATPVAVHVAELEALNNGRKLEFTTESIPLNSIAKVQKRKNSSGKKSVILSIRSDRIEETL